MIKISLLAHTDVPPLALTSHAALMCYQSEVPVLGKLIDVENRLFKVGHHTTLEHFFLTFAIEGLPVGEATLGLHLAHPFYNTDQRSGRYCAKMFVDPDFKTLDKLIQTYWPKVSVSQRKAVNEYIRSGVDIYQAHLSRVTEEAKKKLKKERPFINEKAVELSAPKIAQEQLRYFIPIIFPTALDFSVDLITLVSMYESAWTPIMRSVTKEMARLVINQWPELKFMFQEDRRRIEDWAITPKNLKLGSIQYRPKASILSILGGKDFVFSETKDTHPVDKLHFAPEKMENNIGEIRSRVEISLATMGQDQRHRTISRGRPELTGAFYLPPLVKDEKMEKEASRLMKKWQSISRNLPSSLAMLLAPYGAVVRYTKRSSFNALAHEQGKRLCFCAQEEIYHLGRAMRKAIEKKVGSKSPLLRIFEPPCYRTGICAEGGRFCGRDVKKRLQGDYFPYRSV